MFVSQYVAPGQWRCLNPWTTGPVCDWYGIQWQKAEGCFWFCPASSPRFCGTGHIDQRGIHNGAASRHPSGPLQAAADCVKKHLADTFLLQQGPEVQQSRGIQDILLEKVDSHKFSLSKKVFLTGWASFQNPWEVLKTSDLKREEPSWVPLVTLLLPIAEVFTVFRNSEMYPTSNLF